MELSPFFFALIILIRDVQLVDVDLGGLVKQTVAGNEAVLHNCSKDQDQVLQQCYLNMFSSYGINSSQLPLASSDPFKAIRYDATGMCRYLQIIILLSSLITITVAILRFVIVTVMSSTTASITILSTRSSLLKSTPSTMFHRRRSSSSTVIMEKIVGNHSDIIMSNGFQSLFTTNACKR